MYGSGGAAIWDRYSLADASPPVCSPDNEGTYWTPPGATDDSGAVLTIGSGDRGILLVPQSEGGICQWLETGRRLSAEGYRVAMMNWAQPYGESVTAAYTELQSQGARSILLMGASMGPRTRCTWRRT